jgi:hypothetical protein
VLLYEIIGGKNVEQAIAYLLCIIKKQHHRKYRTTNVQNLIMIFMINPKQKLAFHHNDKNSCLIK